MGRTSSFQGVTRHITAPNGQSDLKIMAAPRNRRQHGSSLFEQADHFVVIALAAYEIYTRAVMRLSHSAPSRVVGVTDGTVNQQFLENRRISTCGCQQ